MYMPFCFFFGERFLRGLRLLTAASQFITILSIIYSLFCSHSVFIMRNHMIIRMRCLVCYKTWFHPSICTDKQKQYVIWILSCINPFIIYLNVEFCFKYIFNVLVMDWYTFRLDVKLYSDQGDTYTVAL